MLPHRGEAYSFEEKCNCSSNLNEVAIFIKRIKFMHSMQIIYTNQLSGAVRGYFWYMSADISFKSKKVFSYLSNEIGRLKDLPVFLRCIHLSFFF